MQKQKEPEEEEEGLLPEQEQRGKEGLMAGAGWSLVSWRVVGLVLVAGTAAVLLAASQSPAPTSGAAPEMQQELAAGDKLHLDLDLASPYFAESLPKPGEDYLSVDEKRLVEPGMATTLALKAHTVRNSPPMAARLDQALEEGSLSCSWLIALSGEVSPAYDHAAGFSQTSVGVTVEAVFPAPGDYSVEVSCKGGVGDMELETFTTKLRGFYVRRELRELSKHDRDKFLDAILFMQNVPTSEGKSMTGSKYYYDLEYFASIHTAAAGARDLDKVHDGLGLLTQHIALSNAFERSLQAIDSSIALPYWDYTLEMYQVKNKYGYNDIGKIFSDSELFSAEWFGRTENNRIADGRFAQQTVASNRTSGTHSPYGFLRAPWNLNPSPFVTRYHKMCGVEPTKLLAYEESYFSSEFIQYMSFQWPTCASHLKLLKKSSWYDFSWEAGYLPHGPVHSWTGGVGGGCDDLEDKLGTYLGTKNVDMLKTIMFAMLKNFWRYEYTEMPSFCSVDSEEDCKVRCNSKREDIMTGLVLGTLSKSLPFKYNIPTEDETSVAKIIACDSPYWPGDHLEAASPAEASFWPIHPTLERLLHLKLHSEPFKTTYWLHADESNSSRYTCLYYDSTNCVGHNPGDLTWWPTVHKSKKTGTYEYGMLSNQELRGMTHPLAYRLPYVYNHFRWDHCVDQDIHFPIPSQYRDDITEEDFVGW